MSAAEDELGSAISHEVKMIKHFEEMLLTHRQRLLKLRDERASHQRKL